MTSPKQGPPERPCLGHGHSLLTYGLERLDPCFENLVEHYLGELCRLWLLTLNLETPLINHILMRLCVRRSMFGDEYTFM